MKRIFLFIITNLAILLVLSITLRILGVDRILDAEGSGIEFNSLLIMAGGIGYSGSLSSLAMSEWSAKRMSGQARRAQPWGPTQAEDGDTARSRA